MTADVCVSITQDEGRHRYEAHLGGQVAGYCEYELAGSVITFTHTVVDPAFEGRGVGSALAVRVLDDARARGLSVVPACRFIAAFIQRHGGYGDLVL